MTQRAPNPLLNKVRMPGATFALPSGGEFYEKDTVEFEAGKPEVYVSPMTTMDEISITSVDKLLNGTAVTEVFGRCIPSIKDVRLMLSSDIDYLLVALRTVSFGQYTDVTYNHKCSEDAKEHSYSIDIESEILDKTKKLTKQQLKGYTTTLSTNLHDEFTPLTYGGLLMVQEKLDHLQILIEKYDNLKRSEEQRRVGDQIQHAQHDYFVTLMMNTVKSMDGITDQEMIFEALSNMVLPVREELLDAQNKLEEWGTPNRIKIKCSDCGEEAEVILDLNPVSFFTKHSKPKTAS